MPITLDSLVSSLNTESTILLFGAGATIPSGAPSVATLSDDIASRISVKSVDYKFAELCSLFEFRRSRKELVDLVRQRFKNLRPSGGILNTANYDWTNIFTTNYDDILEKVYLRAQRDIKVFSSNFDFGGTPNSNIPNIFKIHGTIGLDVTDGHRSRLILTSEDNEAYEDYREDLYRRLESDLAFADLLIIGYSLSDPDLDELVRKCIKIRQASQSARKVYLLLYTPDENKALLYENRGIKVAFGDIDRFFFELGENGKDKGKVHQTSTSPLGENPILNSVTVEIDHQAKHISPDFAKMFVGSPPTYADIRAGFTFTRTLTASVMEGLQNDQQFAMFVGVSGVGKTALARQSALGLVERGFMGWEHNPNREFLADQWRSVAAKLQQENNDAVLVLDDAHLYISEINRLADAMRADDSTRLRLILTSAKNHWKPRVKSPTLFRFGKLYEISTLDSKEVSGLLHLVESQSTVSRLVDRSFKGFTFQERRRRLEERCNRDFFVCLKNIFANDNFDIIILREYSAVSSDYQDVYKHICALESFGVRVHRQLIVRLLQIAAQEIPTILGNLDGLVEEYEIDSKQGIFGWGGRHQVISEIITNHKFNDQNEIYMLLRKIIKNISPTYDIEIRTIRQLCGPEGGLSRISNAEQVNELLRMMISACPQERVPRHRLITNLIRHGKLPDAETEIRVFENDLGADGPVKRYKVRLLVERAISVAGLMPEDKAFMLNEAFAASERILQKDTLNRQSLQLHADVCFEIFRLTGDYDFIDNALVRLKAAEKELGDPDITRAISRYEQRLRSTSTVEPELDTIEIDLE